jgi:hypothetical protein
MTLVHLTLLLLMLLLLFMMFSWDLLQQKIQVLSTMNTNQMTLPIPLEKLFKIRSIFSFAAFNSLFTVSVFRTGNKYFMYFTNKT